MASATTAISDQYRFHDEYSPTARWAITNLTRRDVLSVLTGEATLFDARPDARAAAPSLVTSRLEMVRNCKMSSVETAQPYLNTLIN